MRFVWAFTLCCAVVLACVVGTSAAVPSQMTVQGRLTDASGSPVPAGDKTFTFRIYGQEAEGTQIWPLTPDGEDQTITTDVMGLWTAQVGAVIPLTDVVFASEERWLEVKVDDGVNPPEILSRIRFNTSPYAFQATISQQAADAALLGGQPPSSYAASTHSHTEADVTDEPGIAAGRAAGPTAVYCGITEEMKDLVSVTITIPASGYVVVQAWSVFQASGTTSFNKAIAQIDETAGGYQDANRSVEVGLMGYVNTSSHNSFPVSLCRVYSKAAGTYTFRLEAVGYGTICGGAMQFVKSVITATYHPTAYGTITE